MTSPNRDWALIIHADSGDTRVDVYWCDINAGREGLKLAREVKAWRQRSDLLTLGNRLRVIAPSTEPTEDDPERQPDPPSPAAPDVPALPPDSAADASRTASRREYLRGRVRAVVGHSEPARFALQRHWPIGVPGLKQDGQTWDQLEALTVAIERVEKDYSVPFYPAWRDPIDEAKREHPSNRWAKPTNDTKQSDDDKLNLQTMLSGHPRSALLRQWIGDAVAGGIDHNIDTTALAHALYEFARVDESVWPDNDLTEMLHASLHTLGYVNGTRDLGKFNPTDAPLLMSAAFAVAAGTVAIVYKDDGSTEMITDVVAKNYL